MMARGGRRRKGRVQGSDGKYYDPEKQRDNGYQAHETRVGTAARRTRWRLQGAGGYLWRLLLVLALPLRLAWRGFKAGWNALMNRGSRGRR